MKTVEDVEKKEIQVIEEKNPYEITKYDRTHTTNEIFENYEELEGKDVKIAGRITRIVNDKELTLSDHSGHIDVYIDSLDLNIVRLLNEGDIVGVAITYDSSKDKFIANDLTLLTKTRIGIDYKNTNIFYFLINKFI